MMTAITDDDDDDGGHQFNPIQFNPQHGLNKEKQKI